MRKKSISKIISIAIVVVLLLNFTCSTAFAAEDGTTVQISNISAPEAGQLPDFSATLSGDYYEFYEEEGGYIINGITWYNVTDDTNIDEDTPFEENKVYKVTAVIVPKGNNEWVLETATINGKNADVATSSDCYIISYTFGNESEEPEEDIELTPVTHIDITGIDEPKRDYFIDYTATVTTTGCKIKDLNEDYYKNGIFWFDDTENDYVDPSSVYIVGHTYRVSICLEAEKGYYLENPTVTINGIEARVYSENGSYNAMVIMETVADPEEISDVSLLNITTPFLGNTPDFDITFGSSAYKLYDTEPITWYKNGYIMQAGEQFQSGYTYSVSFWIAASTNYSFKLNNQGNPDINASLNGLPAEVSVAYEQDPQYVIEVKYTFGDAINPNITNIAITGISAPVSGNEPTYEAILDKDNYSLEDKNNVYYKNGIAWYDVTDGCNLIIGEDTFKAGHIYQIEIYLVPAENYSFNLSTATINGGNAEIWGGKTGAVLYYTFEACEGSLSTISGTVSSQLNTGSNDVEIKLYEYSNPEVIKSEIISGTNEEYSLSDISAGEYYITVSKAEHTERRYCIEVEEGLNIINLNLFKNGDANMDGELTVNDYQQVVNSALSEDNYSPYYTTADTDYSVALCDYDGDGYIDVIDCALVARLIEGGISVQYDSIEITGLTSPVTGQLPSYEAILDDSRYEIYDEEFGYIYNGVTWYDLTDDTNLDKDYKFISGHSYKVTVEVIPSNNGEWNLKYATINGNTAIVEEADDCYLISYTFTIEEGDAITITDLTEPVAGQLPSYKATLDDSKYKIYDEEFGYIYNGVTWYDLTEDSNIDVDDKFIAGHTYKVTIEVIPRNGEDWKLKYATINDNAALVEEADDCYLVSYVFDVA